MRAFVTGGAGFIGSNLAKILLNDGWEVTVLDNLFSGYHENLQGLEPIDFAQGDVRDYDTVHRHMNGCEVIFHLAASVGNSRAINAPIHDSEINVLGTLNVLEAARSNCVRKIVYSSSAGVYGEPLSLPISEDHPAAPDSPYGVSKLAGEKHCLCYSQLYDINAVCLRYFNVYGVHQRYDPYGNVIPIFATRIVNDEPITIFGDGNQTRDFVNVRDVVRANICAAKSDNLSGVFNIASGSAITINQLAETMISLSGREIAVDYAERRPGDVEESQADISAAREHTGYAPETSLDKGLREYLSWFETVEGGQ